MVTTREIAMDRRTFFNVLLRINFRPKTQMLYAAALLLAIVWIVIIPYQQQLWLLIAAVLLFPVLILFLTWRTSRNKMNQSFMAPRYYTMLEGEITAHLTDGEAEPFNVARPTKVIRTKSYYLVFTTAIEFLYIPYEAFQSEADRTWFEEQIVRRARKVQGRKR